MNLRKLRLINKQNYAPDEMKFRKREIFSGEIWEIKCTKLL